MARRSSARLRNRKSATPTRVSLSHDAPIRSPRTAPSKLSALQESDEMPGAFPSSASPPPKEAMVMPVTKTTTIPVNFDEATPKTTPIKPAAEDMHPAQHQQSTAKPMDEARWLGFADMPPNTEPPKQKSKIAMLQDTPTRDSKSKNGIESLKCQFDFRREHSLELSPAAKTLMNEKREEATRIREQMIANGEGLETNVEATGRKIATPKSKKGRFSDVHSQRFKKLDSIAGHASAFRADPNRAKAATPLQSPTKSLKRKLDDSSERQPSSSARAAAKSAQVQRSPHLPKSISSKNLRTVVKDEPSSPSKRVKRTATEDVSMAEPSPCSSVLRDPSTSQARKATPAHLTSPGPSTLASPTQASLSRAASTKSVNVSKIPAPALNRSPSKPTLADRNADGPSTPLLARSPSKASLFSNPNVEKPKSMLSPLLMRTPSKMSPLKGTADIQNDKEPNAAKVPLLSRSPLKKTIVMVGSDDQKQVVESRETLLLAQSPLKASVKSSEPNISAEKPTTATPLLARTPTKVVMPEDAPAVDPPQTASKSSGNGIIGRFNVLRSSPMKSILRSPQRLYSNDPAKVAAGTHLATPPKHIVSTKKATPAPPATAPVEKHVDFTSSTKARYDRAQSEVSSTPSKGPTPPPKADVETKSSPKPIFVGYPTLPSDEDGPIVTPQKRRQTAAPGDFTFTSHGHGIVFGPSPNAPAAILNSKSPSTIRHVSAEPRLPAAPPSAMGSKKRKLDFENEKAIDEEIEGAVSDKENEEEERPTKRMKHSAPSAAVANPVTRVPTLGVKPKKTAKDGKEKKPSMISKARLNALAQPKRRN